MPRPTRRTLLQSAAARPAPGAKSIAHQPGRTPHTRFAANLEMWWRGLPFVRRMGKAAELGYPAVEFWPWRTQNVSAIAAASKRLGLEIAHHVLVGLRFEYRWVQSDATVAERDVEQPGEPITRRIRIFDDTVHVGLAVDYFF